LIVVGIGGLAPLVADVLKLMEAWLFAAAALWLAAYGVIRGYAALRGQATLVAAALKPNGLKLTLMTAAILTFGNPHVYLDTVVLIGTVSLKFEGTAKLAYAVGAICASIMFFSGLGYGAALLSGVMNRPYAWRVLDATVSIVMLVLAFGMARAGGWV
jgi:L-lysine exporter family protein LysE/ArgO